MLVADFRLLDKGEVRRQSTSELYSVTWRLAEREATFELERIKGGWKVLRVVES